MRFLPALWFAKKRTYVYHIHQFRLNFFGMLQILRLNNIFVDEPGFKCSILVSHIHW